MNQKTQEFPLPAPMGPCKECILSHENAATVGDENCGQFKIVYCPHHLAGSALFIQGGRIVGTWRTYSPITEDEFITAVTNGVEGIEKTPMKFDA